MMVVVQWKVENREGREGTVGPISFHVSLSLSQLCNEGKIHIGRRSLYRHADVGE